MIDQDEDLPQAISGTLRTYQLLRDNTLRIVIDIDPRFKAGFHRLFPDNDIPIAVAPLVLDFERREPASEEPKGGPLCRLAGIWCRDEDFQEWICTTYGDDIPVNEEEAAEWIRTICKVSSRSQLDHDFEAAERFQRVVRTPYMAWRKNGGGDGPE